MMLRLCHQSPESNRSKRRGQKEMLKKWIKEKNSNDIVGEAWMSSNLHVTEEQRRHL